MRFDVNDSVLAGVSTATLQAWLAAAQQALQDLRTGAKGESFAYTQGDGAKSVTYTRANVNDLVAWIRELQAALGMTSHPRRAIGVRF